MGKDGGEIDRLLDLLFSDEKLLRQCIEEIQQDIHSRTKLADELICRIREDKTKIEPLLEELSRWAPGYKPSVNGRRSALEQKSLDLSKEEREQRIDLFKNHIALRRELREILTKYCDVTKLKNVLKRQDDDYERSYR